MSDTNRDIDIVIPEEVGPANQAGTVMYLMDCVDGLRHFLGQHGISGQSIIIGMLLEQMRQENTLREDSLEFGRHLVSDETDKLEDFERACARLNPIWTGHQEVLDA